jgi:hypothetical protein
MVHLRVSSIWCVATVLTSTCLTLAEAQEPPVMDTGVVRAGPNSNEADYRYLSLATPRTNNGYDFDYNLCNLRPANMAFYWKDVGFGMDFADPLPSGLCATYELVGIGHTFKAKTTLKFSSGVQSPPAYLPCEGGTECTSKAGSPLSLTAELKAYVIKHLRDEEEPNRPTSVVLPLRVVVRVAGSGDTKEVRVDWAGTGVKFVGFFAESKLGPEQLKQFISPKVGGRFEFDTFPAFKANSGLLLDGASRAAITVSPGDKVASGTLIFEISKGFPPARNVTFLLVDESGRPVARIDTPIPQAKR